MKVEIRVSGEAVTAALFGEIDHHTAGEMRREIDRAVEQNMPALLTLDFSGITFMDSSGVGLVMGRYRNLAKTGAELRVAGTSPQIYKMLKLAGIERLAVLERRV